MGHKQKRNRRIASTGKQLPSYNQILSRLKFQKQTTFLDTKGTKVSDSTRILSLTCEHTSSLQKHSNTFVFVSPTLWRSVADKIIPIVKTKSKLVKYIEFNKKYESRFAKYMFTNKKKTQVEILKFESKKMGVELKKNILESRKRER